MKFLKSIFLYTLGIIFLLILSIVAFVVYVVLFVNFNKELHFFHVTNASQEVFSIEMTYDGEILHTKSLEALSEYSFELFIDPENEYEINYTIGGNSGTQNYNNYDFIEINTSILASPKGEFIIKDVPFEKSEK